MEVLVAQKYGFCFGVKRAIKIAEANKNSHTLGPLIHNPKEIDRLKDSFNVDVSEEIDSFEKDDKVIIRTHGIEKNKKAKLVEKELDIIDATCPFVTKPQEIVDEMSKKRYQIIIFGDPSHPEVKGVKSYADDVYVVSSVNELKDLKFREKIAVVSQTTKKLTSFLEVVNYLISNCKEVRVFNTICNATFDNQAAVDKLAKEVDVLLVVGGKNSSNTKQLLSIAQKSCIDSYLIEDEKDIDYQWFSGKKICGITAGASTPDWIIQKVIDDVSRI